MWHDGIIPKDEVWIKLGGDKGGGMFKINFQIVNTQSPNSVHNTCVFSCFEADDTVTTLHVALDRFRTEVTQMGVQSCLNSLGVCRQRYYGGIFVGNHVHTILKVFFTLYANVY